MKYANAFELIGTEFKKRKIPCVLVGGFAVNFHKVSRQTKDVDILLNAEDAQEALKTLKEAGYIPFQDTDAFTRLRGQESPYLDVDLLYVDIETFQEILKHGIVAKISGKEFIIPSLEHLIALKLHAINSNQKLREMKDLPDIVNLVRYNKVDVKSEKFKTLCLKFGNEELYKKIVFFGEP